MKKNICLLNDSFPPYLDGVANAVDNYARILNKIGTDAFVVTPKFPNSDDEKLSYKVIRMNTLSGNKVNKDGYTIGNPGDVIAMKAAMEMEPNILHTHCLATTFFLGIELKKRLHIPYIMTYHTKHDIALSDSISSDVIRNGVIKVLMSNINKYCDEMWAVSDGAGKNVQSLGYEGDYVVMRNGVDLPRKIIEKSIVDEETKDYDLPYSVPMFLYVGRLYWYKGIKIILDAMAMLKSLNKDFRMVFAGTGKDELEIKEYCTKLKLDDKVFFINAVPEREKLMAWYSRADLLVFPSTFDTNGLVVREASACSLASVLVRGSCAAEDVTDNVDGFLIEENAESLRDKLLSIMNNKELVKKIGNNASNNLYLSWDDAIKCANERYEIILENEYRKI